MNVLISGASSGIGQACALHLARRGARVFAGVRDDAAFARLEELGVGHHLTPVYLDVCNSASIESAVARAGRLDALVNNAGLAVGGAVEHVTLEDWRRQFEVNFFGVVALTRACLPLVRTARGRIVNLSSVSGRVAMPFLGPYAASKFAIEAFSDSLRRETRVLGVRVSLIEPGAIATPLWRKSVDEGVGRLPTDFEDPYAPLLKRFTNRLNVAIAHAGPVDLVTRAVEHALYARRPRVRYVVGRGIRLMTFLNDLVPAAWVDRGF